MFFSTITLSLVISLCCFAESRYSVILGSDSHEILWLRQKKIKNKEVYIIGYQSPQKRQLERVMPRRDFAAAVKELHDFAKGIRRRQALSPNPFCQESVAIENNNKPEILCLDSVDRKGKEKLVRWVAKQSDLVVGVD